LKKGHQGGYPPTDTKGQKEKVGKKGEPKGGGGGGKFFSGKKVCPPTLGGGGGGGKTQREETKPRETKNGQVPAQGGKNPPGRHTQEKRDKRQKSVEKIKPLLKKEGVWRPQNPEKKPERGKN